ncbi:penicillin-binding protein 1A [bacterium SCSIO 12696]|nr:penicillin-binding protein 1A [bacterium SCSIO 12696]
MKLPSKPLIGSLIRLTIAGIGGLLLIAASLYLYLSPKLPTVETLKAVKLQTPLRIYSQDSKLIGEFGQQRRNPIAYEDIPQNLVYAILAAEDSRFFEHKGIDPRGLARAVKQMVVSGQRQGGGSTLTMQVARNFFLSKKKEFTRKFNEILLSFRIEDELTKEEIFSLYANKMFLGKRAYGVQAAANVYYGKTIDELSLAQTAMIAVLFQLPSTQNPINDPDSSLERRNWILGRMHTLGRISEEDYQTAVAEPVTATYHGPRTELNAPYVSEMVRLEAKQIVANLNRSDAYQDTPIDMMNDGLRIYTTLDSTLQKSARRSLRDGLVTYDQRHGYRGPERNYSDSEQWPQVLKDTPVVGDLIPAIVSNIQEQQLTLLIRSGELVTLNWEDDLKQVRGFITTNRYRKFKSVAEEFTVGDLVRLKQKTRGGWALSQIPRAQSALVALSPEDGAIRSLVGGFDFDQSQYNRITQAKRQPGSNFKPFIYTAALNSGMTAASTISGASISMADSLLEGYWQPENDGGEVYGETRIRKGLYKSLNTVSIRLLRTIGLNAAINGASRFGFDPNALPDNFTLALGSHAVPPLEVARGYAVFANGGYLIDPYLIERVEDVYGNILFQANPARVPQEIAEEETQPPESAVDQLDLEQAEQELEQLGIDIWAQQNNSDSGQLDEQPQQEAEADSSTESEAEAKPESKVAPRVIEPRIAYIMDSILKDVIRKGTGVKAKQLKRNDIAGKTGTTNDAKDAWFSGYSPHIVATAWVGFDDNSPLGSREYGGSAALPIWIEFMRTALRNQPDEPRLQPDGLVQVRIDPKTGKRVNSSHPGAVFEIFRREHLPPEPESSVGGNIERELLNEELL